MSELWFVQVTRHFSTIFCDNLLNCRHSIKTSVQYNGPKFNQPTLSRISPEPELTPSLPFDLTSHLWGNRDKTSWVLNKWQPGEAMRFLQALEYEPRVMLVCIGIISHLNVLLVRCEGILNQEFLFAYHLHVGRTRWSLELDLNGGFVRASRN